MSSAERVRRLVSSARTVVATPVSRAARSGATHALVVVGVGLLVVIAGTATPASLELDGARFTLAASMADGRVPYRDLLSGIPPGAYALEAFGLTLLGRSVGVSRTVFALAGDVGYALLTYLIARRLVGGGVVALLAAVAVPLLAGPVPGAVLASSLVAVGLTAGWISTGATALLLAAGVATGIAAIFSFSTAAATLLAITLTVASRGLSARWSPTGGTRVRTAPPLTALVAGTLLGFAPFLAGVALERGLPTLARYAAEAITVAMAGGAQPPHRDLTTLDGARLTLPLLCLPLLLAISARAARREPGRDRALVGVLLGSWLAIRFGAAQANPDDQSLFSAGADLPLATAWALGWILAARGRIALARWDFVVALAIGLGAAAVWRLTADRPAAALVPLGAAAACAWMPIGPRFGFAADSRRLVRVAVLLLIVTLVPTGLLLAPGRLTPASTDGLKRLSGTWWPPGEAEQVTAAADAIRELSEPDDAVFVYPGAGLVYTQARRRNPTSFPQFEADAATFEVDRALRELRRDEPAVVVIRYEAAGLSAGRLAPLTRFLEDGYVEDRRLNAPELWGVWIKASAPQVCRRLLLYAYLATRLPRRGEVAPLDIGRVVDGQADAELVQRVPTARFPVPVGAGAFLRFSAEADSRDADLRERAVVIEAAGQQVEVWRGPADGTTQRIVLPPLPTDRAVVVLRSPPGETTLWTNPTLCVPR